MASNKSSASLNENPGEDSSQVTERGAAPFPVAGIGASAGGLEAISAFLEHLPDNTGISYVIVQHLAPNHQSILPELLEKKTAMPVHQVKDRMAIAPNQVYVIPPNTYMSIIDGHLTLFPREDKQGIFLPIDFFFKNLAYIYQNKAIGILLSGTGSDGTAGFKDIKAEGGITFAQDDTAAFNGMPRSAVDSGFVDFILPAAEIASELNDILKLPYTLLEQTDLPTPNEAELRRILVILNNRKGVDFSLYKETTINRRIHRRMALSRKKSLGDYTQLLRENNKEVEQLYQDLLINVTSFFRDPVAFRSLDQIILPGLLKNRKPNDPLRIWVAACATGEEACSIAIAVFEHLEKKELVVPFQIFATDINPLAIEKARSGIYQAGSMENVSTERLKKYFTKIDGQYQVVKAIRDVCVFATHNLLTDPPFSRMDIVSCQNVMIYFEPNAQKKILKAFHYALKPSGFLLLGKSETVGSSSEFFSQANKDQKVYTKKDIGNNADFDFSFSNYRINRRIDTSSGFLQNEKVNESDIEKVSNKILLSQFVPPSVVVNSDLQILSFHGPASPYLQPAYGKASLHLLKMVRDDLAFEVRSLINKAKKEAIPVKKSGIHLVSNDRSETVTLEVMPMRTSSPDPYFLVLFHETAESYVPEKKPVVSGTDRKVAEDELKARLEHELREAKEQVRTMGEEFEATREELQSANEEVLSSNEELQSINEELETSKEELQSTNEELTTINEELHHRNNDLKEAFEYREAIVETIREPLVVLNTELRVSTANSAFYKDFNQKQSQTEGFFLYEMNNGEWNIPGLKEKLLEIISKDTSFEDFEVEHTFSIIGKRIILFSALRMRFNENKKDRILLVLEDITLQRRAEEKLLQSLQLNSSILNSISDIFISVDNNWNLRFINRKAEDFTGKKHADLIGKNLWEVLTYLMDTDFHKKLMLAMKSKKADQFEYYDEQSKEWYHFRLYPSESTLTIYGNNISNEKNSQRLLEESKIRYEQFFSATTEGIWRFDLKEKISTNLPASKQLEAIYENAFVAECNNAIAKMYGYINAKELIGISLKEVMMKNERNKDALVPLIDSGYRISDMETTITEGENSSYFLHNMIGMIENGMLVSIWGTQRDITSQKLIESTLVKTRNQLNFSLAAGSVGTYIWDFKTKKITWTKVQESLYGLQQYSFKGTLNDWLSFIHPDDVDATRKAIQDSIKNQKELSIEFRIFWPDRSLHWILTRANLGFDKKGKPVEMSGVNIDISERKFKEQIIRENEERFKALVQNSFDVITVFNLDGTISYQSESIERVLGYSAKERLGENLFTDSVVHPDDREVEKKLFQKCIENPSDYVQGELRMMHKDGTYRIMEVGCVNLINNSSIQGIIKNCRDITERRAIEKQKEEFIGVASHELKTPVTSIKAYAQILYDTLLEKEDHVSADLLLRMDHQIDRLTTLIKDLLDVTKITEGQLILKHERYNLNELINEVTADVQMTTKKHVIIKELQEVKPIIGDKERTSQIIVNLLSNAIKYSPSADKVIIRTVVSSQFVTVSIQDFGIGISKEMQKKLFKRFFRVTDESTSTFPGLGLGLFIATEIVKKQRGRIWVESTPNKGSTFSFTLPFDSKEIE